MIDLTNLQLNMNPLINILIRTSYRPTTFTRCIQSVANQTYRNIRVIVSYDDERALEYIPDWCEKLPVVKNNEPFGYNLYCNDLKAQVKEGWFFFLDDDDRLASSTVIDELADEIRRRPIHNALIARFIRGKVIKPYSNDLIKGQIGMPCLVLDAEFKDVEHFKATEDADFYFIKNTAHSYYACIDFIDLILVRASRRGRGYTEEVNS